MRSVLLASLSALIVIFLSNLVQAADVGRAKILRMPSSEDYYPAASKEAGHQGKVTVRACVNSDAQFESAIIASSSGHEDLDTAAINLARAGRYQPDRVDDKAIPSCVSFRVNFSIEETFTLEGGETYVGEMKSGMPHGQGTFTKPDGYKYVGEWKDGNHHGQGTLTLPDGAKYIGEFRDNFASGQGTVSTPAGEVYTGEFQKGFPNGHGKLMTPDGRTYVGEVKNGKPTGKAP